MDPLKNWLFAYANPRDRPLLNRQVIKDAIDASINESAHQGADGLFDALRIYPSSWEFDPADIELPVQLWQGFEDRVVPWQHGRYLTNPLPLCKAFFLPGEGHYSLPIDHMGRIQDKLLERCKLFSHFIKFLQKGELLGDLDLKTPVGRKVIALSL